MSRVRESPQGVGKNPSAKTPLCAWQVPSGDFLSGHRTSVLHADLCPAFMWLLGLALSPGGGPVPPSLGPRGLGRAAVGPCALCYFLRKTQGLSESEWVLGPSSSTVAMQVGQRWDPFKVPSDLPRRSGHLGTVPRVGLPLAHLHPSLLSVGSEPSPGLHLTWPGQAACASLPQVWGAERSTPAGLWEGLLFIQSRDRGGQGASAHVCTCVWELLCPSGPSCTPAHGWYHHQCLGRACLARQPEPQTRGRGRPADRGGGPVDLPWRVVMGCSQGRGVFVSRVGPPSPWRAGAPWQMDGVNCPAGRAGHTPRSCPASRRRPPSALPRPSPPSSWAPWPEDHPHLARQSTLPGSASSGSYLPAAVQAPGPRHVDSFSS